VEGYTNDLKTEFLSLKNEFATILYTCTKLGTKRAQRLAVIGSIDTKDETSRRGYRGDLVEFVLGIERHEVNTRLHHVLEVIPHLARVGIDDTAGINIDAEVKDSLKLSLAGTIEIAAKQTKDT